MSTIVWQSPVPSSGFTRGTSLQIRPRREIAVVFEFEDDNGDSRNAELIFKDVVHYRTTYLIALRASQIDQAYDRLVELSDSPELKEVMEAARENRIGSTYRHYRVCFDDGPCFDFICSSFLYVTL